MRKVLKDLEVTWIPVFLSLARPPSRVQRVTSGKRSPGDKTPSLIILCFTFFMNPWMINYDLWLPEQEGPRTVGPQGTTSAQSSALRPSQQDNHVSSRGLLASSVLPRCHLSCPLFPLPQPGLLRKLFFSNSPLFPSPTTCSRKLALTLMVASSSTSSNSSSLDRGHSSKSILAANNAFRPFYEKS